LKKWGKKFALHPVGTGPFIFKEWIPNKLITLVKNPHYWDGPVYLDSVIYKSIPNNRSRLLALKSNAIDGMDGLDPNMVKEIRMNKNLRLISTSCFNIGYLSMNMEKAPFDRMEVRHAVNHSINKQNLVKLLYRGSAIPAKNPIPPTMWGYNDEIIDYEYNPEKARALLRSVGLPNGFKTTLWVMPIPRPYMPQPRKIARAIKANLLAVGIKAKIVSHDWKTYLRKLQNGEHDMCLLGWSSDNGDPDNILYVLFNKDNAVKPNAENISFIKNKALDAVLNKAQQVFEKQERIKLYRKAQEIIHANAPWVPLAHADVCIGLRKKVHGIVLQPREIISFKRAWLE
ncbi:MAG: ABC transporter substrate-binding protein, partial [Desulfobacterales bacterium]|nr:ABC transporter substrate-binding protein [Desulfobacterales bacterium]